MAPENSVAPLPANSDSLPTLNQNPPNPNQPTTAPPSVPPTSNQQIPNKKSNVKIIIAILFVTVTLSAIGIGSYLLIKSNAKYKSQTAPDQQAATRSSALEDVKSRSDFENIGKVAPGPSPSPKGTNFTSDFYAFDVPSGWIVSNNKIDFEAYDPNHLPRKIQIKNYSLKDAKSVEQQVKAADTIQKQYIYLVNSHQGSGGVMCYANEEKCIKTYIVIGKDKQLTAVVTITWDKTSIQNLVNKHLSAAEINALMDKQSLIDPSITDFESQFFNTFRFVVKP